MCSFLRLYVLGDNESIIIKVNQPLSGTSSRKRSPPYNNGLLYPILVGYIFYLEVTEVDSYEFKRKQDD